MANSKITQLPAEASPALDDLVAIVDDVAGTPTTKKATLANVLALVESGGNETFTSGYSSPPGSPAEGDLWIPNDTCYVFRYSGSVWVPWGPIFPMTPPPAVSSFTWVNQGDATAADSKGGLYLLGPAVGGQNVRALVMAAPATPYTITAGFLTSNHSGPQCGLIWRQSSDGKLVTHGLTSSGSTFYLNGVNYNSPTSAVVDAWLFTGQPPSWGSVIWFRLADNGTNRIVSVSADKQNWRQVFSVSRTNFMTADQVGIFVNAIGAYNADMTLISWE